MMRLEDAVDQAVASAAIDPAWAETNGRPPHPSFRFNDDNAKAVAHDMANAVAHDMEEAVARGARVPEGPGLPQEGSAPGVIASVIASNPSPKLAGFATSRLRLWLTRDEREVLERAITAVRRARGPDLPWWACIDELLDHFTEAYEDPAHVRLSRRSAVLLRDDWQCQAPGCRARSGLHVHHILARGVGGPNTFGNLLTVCDVHHLAIHRGWIACWGTAPSRIRWSFGVKRRPLWFADSPSTLRLSQAKGGRGARDAHDEADPWVRPIAEFVGQYRLREGEAFPTVERRLFGEVTRVRAA
jgi:hypothetical protein